MKRLVIPVISALALVALPACSTTSAPAKVQPAAAISTAPSDESLKELLELCDASKLIDNMWVQVEGAMKGMIAQSTKGQQLNAQQQAAIDSFQSKYSALMREELSWAKMEPMFLRIYKNSLSQAEIDGMIAFYKTPAGQAVIKKMPVLMQQIMAEMPAMVGPLMQKMQPLVQQLQADMKAASEAPAAPAAGQK